MRLIDADQLRYKSLYHGMIDVPLKPQSETVFFVTYEDIENAPTVDPVKHGCWVETHPEWKWEYRSQKCSCCGAEHKNQWRFCPSCGAQMRMTQCVCWHDGRCWGTKEME